MRFKNQVHLEGVVADVDIDRRVTGTSNGRAYDFRVNAIHVNSGKDTYECKCNADQAKAVGAGEAVTVVGKLFMGRNKKIGIEVEMVRAQVAAAAPQNAKQSA